MAPQQWRPSNGTPAMAPSIGTQWHTAMAPNGTQQWHLAMAPSNGTQREPRQSWCPSPLLLEVRAPTAKAIWGKINHTTPPPQKNNNNPTTKSTTLNQPPQPPPPP